VDAEDGRLRRVDDRRRQHRTENAAVGDREGAAGEFLDRDLAVLGLLAELGDLLLDLGQLIWSASRRIGTTRPRGLPTAMPMSK
jgi:hypothetical protein